jgi:heme ABC exporter ATP-binding subunit CcmA
VTGRFPALAGVDLAVDQGDVVVLEGPNGAGKTSVLRVCAGLLPVSAGRATVLGCELPRDRAGLRHRVGLLGHGAALYDDLTVLENMRFGVRAGGAAVAGIEPALDRWELSTRTRRTPVGRLSAGQRRRVALALLLARAPELWLLDEPHAGLDTAARTILDEVIVDVASRGATVILASHELDRAQPIADHIVSLVGGRVVGVRATRSAPAAVPSPMSTPLRSPAVPGGAHVA